MSTRGDAIRKTAAEKRAAREREDQEVFLQFYGEHGTIAAACRHASAKVDRSVSPSVVQRWLRLDADFIERFRILEDLQASTEEAKTIFLEELVKAGVVTKACEAASARTGRDIWASHVVRWRKDPEFGLRFDEAREAASDILEHTARVRAVEGIDKPVIYQGAITDTYKEYSDTLLALLLKADRPKFRDASKLELTGKDGGPMETREVGDVERARRVAFALARGLRAVEQQQNQDTPPASDDGSDLC